MSEKKSETLYRVSNKKKGYGCYTLNGVICELAPGEIKSLAVKPTSLSAEISISIIKPVDKTTVGKE